MKRLWVFLKEAFLWILAAIAGLILLPGLIIYAIWKLSPFGKDAPSPPAGQVTPPRPDVVQNAQDEWDKEILKIKEKDHEKTISGIINDAGNVVNGQPVTIQRDGYFTLNGTYVEDPDKGGN